MHREHNDFDIWELANDSAGCTDPVEYWHGQVHQHNVGLSLSCKRHGLFTVAGFADDFFPGVFESSTDSVSKNLMVIS